MAVPALVVFARRADGESFLLGDPTEMLLHGFEHFFVHQGFVAQSSEVSHDVEYGGLGRSVGQRRNRRVDDPDALLDGLQEIERSQSVVTVGVKFHGNVSDVVEHESDESSRALRR